jgi:hypothetical protein
LVDSNLQDKDKHSLGIYPKGSGDTFQIEVSLPNDSDNDFSRLFAKIMWRFSYDVVDYDVCICGNDIIDIVLAAEKYSGIDTSSVRARIEEKRIWLRDNEPYEYQMAVGEDTDIFTLWIRKGYIDSKLIPVWFQNHPMP